MSLESIQIHMNSNHATSYNNNLTSDCNFTLPLIEVPSQHYLWLSVIHANIPYSFYNIESSNSTLVYYISNVKYRLDIPFGNYNVRQLLSYLKSQMLNFNIIYNSITNKFTFTHLFNDFDFDDLESTCFKLIGFLYYSRSSLKSLTSLNSIDLMTHKCICIMTDFNTGSINLSNKSNMSILQSMAVSDAPFGMLNMNYTPNRVCLYINSISTMRLKITDQSNRPIEFNGCGWTITLQLDVIKFVE